MAKNGRRNSGVTQQPEPIQELQRLLIGLQDDLTETMAWTALVCDGLCGILSEHHADIDPAHQHRDALCGILAKTAK